MLAAEQTPGSQEWFQGTADAVRQSLHAHAQLPAQPRAHPLGRPALPDGLPRDAAAPPRERRRHDHRRHPRCTPTTRPASASSRPTTAHRITEFHEKPSRRLAGKDSPVSEAHAAAGRRLPRVDGHLPVRHRGAAARARRTPRGRRLRQGDHPVAHRHAPRRRVPLRRLLERHRDGALVLRRQHRARASRSRSSTCTTRTMPLYTNARMLPPAKITRSLIQDSLVCDGRGDHRRATSCRR